MSIQFYSTRVLILTLVTAAFFPVYAQNPITFDSDMIFWLDITRGEVHRAKSDGSEATVIIDDPSLNLPDGIAVDPHAGKVYWTNMAPGPDGFLQRANLDGSDIETIIEPGLTHTPKQLKIDFDGGKLYWSDREGGKVQRSNLDGSDMEILVSERSFPVGISVDFEGGVFYWSDKNDGHVLRAGIEMPDGDTPENRSDIDTIIAGFPDPIDLDLDLGDDMLYWTDRTVGAVLRNPLQFSDGEDAFNRTDIDTLVTGLTDPIGISLDLDGRQIYFTELGGEGVWRSNLDGSEAEVLATGTSLVGIVFVKYPLEAVNLPGRSNRENQPRNYPGIFLNIKSEDLNWPTGFTRNLLGQSIERKHIAPGVFTRR